MTSSVPQLNESDGTVNSVHDEPKVKGKDIRKACLGCGDIHGGVQSELNCLRAALRTKVNQFMVIKDMEEVYRGSGMCKTACCQGKAMYCARCSKT